MHLLHMKEVIAYQLRTDASDIHTCVRLPFISEHHRAQVMKLCMTHWMSQGACHKDMHDSVNVTGPSSWRYAWLSERHRAQVMKICMTHCMSVLSLGPAHEDMHDSLNVVGFMSWEIEARYRSHLHLHSSCFARTMPHESSYTIYSCIFFVSSLFFVKK